MDRLRLLIGLGGLLIRSQVYGAIQRFEDGSFQSTFDVMYDARMLNALMYFLQINLNECLYKCMIHRACVTINHNSEKRICELVGREFDEDEIEKSRGWMNFRPRQKVDGRYSNWKNLTSCQPTCGNRTQQLYRECNNPAPQYGGKNCEGPEVKAVKCDYVDCPVDGNWSEWTATTNCQTKECGVNQSFKRTCTQPGPAHGGLACLSLTGGKSLLETKQKQCVECKRYKIDVKTYDGTIFDGAGTDANVFIQLIGDKGNSDKVQLKANGNPFEDDDLDTFNENIIDVGNIKELVVGHDNANSNAGWKVDYIDITVNKCTTKFVIQQWISEGSGLQKTIDNPQVTCS